MHMAPNAISTISIACPASGGIGMPKRSLPAGASDLTGTPGPPPAPGPPASPAGHDTPSASAKPLGGRPAKIPQATDPGPRGKSSSAIDLAPCGRAAVSGPALPPGGPPRVPEKTLVPCAPVGELPEAPGGVGPLTVGTAPASACPAVEVAACPVLVVASLSALVTVPVGEPDPVAGALDLGASETRVGDGDEELTLTEGDGETVAFTVVAERPVPEDEPGERDPLAGRDHP